MYGTIFRGVLICVHKKEIAKPQRLVLSKYFNGHHSAASPSSFPVHVRILNLLSSAINGRHSGLKQSITSGLAESRGVTYTPPQNSSLVGSFRRPFSPPQRRRRCCACLQSCGSRSGAKSGERAAGRKGADSQQAPLSAAAESAGPPRLAPIELRQGDLSRGTTGTTGPPRSLRKTATANRHGGRPAPSVVRHSECQPQVEGNSRQPSSLTSVREALNERQLLTKPCRRRKWQFHVYT